MVTYIYFVKCPNCEDEHFDFFDEAKEFALGCLSQKPIITQVEVDRNDFGECTDHCDLGTVWSWEDVMGKETDAEPTTSIFTKDDFAAFEGSYNPDNDPEFYEMDSSVDCEPETPEVSPVERKPIPEGMTIEQLVEEMEENEDTVECTWCEELFDKSECRKEVDLGWLCSRCEMAIKSRGETLTFREGNYWDFLDEKLDIDFSNCIDSSDMEIWGVEPTSEATYKAVLMKKYEDVDFHSFDATQTVHDEMLEIGGLFVFYFDKAGAPCLDSWNPELLRSLGNCEIIFDDERYDLACEKTLSGSTSKTESLSEEMSLADLVKDSISHLTNDLGKDPWVEDFADDVIKDIENNYDIEVPEDPEKYRSWASAVAIEVSRQLNNSDNLTEASLSDIAAAANSEFGTSWDDDYLLDVAGVDDDFRTIDSFGDTLPKTKKTREWSSEEIAKRDAKKAEHERQKNMRFAQRYVAKYGAERYNLQYPISRKNWNQEWPYYDEATGEFVEGERRDELVKKFEDEQQAKRMAEYEERRKQPIWYIRYICNKRERHFMIRDGNTKEEALAQAIEYIKELAEEALAKGKRFDWNESDVQVVAGRGPGGGELQHFEEDFDPEIVHDLGNEYDGGYPTEKPELPEIDEVSDSHLRLCPECGKETFDIETGICVECGFN